MHSRPEIEEDKEIWQPRWNCFCCRDTGMVSLNLVKMIIPDYEDGTDLRVACQNPECLPGKDFRGNHNFDQRFSLKICLQLQEYQKKNWQETVQEKQRILLETKLLAENMSMRCRPRTAEEENLAQVKHQEVLIEEGAEKIKEAVEYLGKDFWENGEK